MKSNYIIFTLVFLILVHLLSLHAYSSETALKDTITSQEDSCEVSVLSQWSEVEQWVWKQLCLGKEANLNKKYKTYLDPKNPDAWSENVKSRRKLRTSFIEKILLNEPWKNLIPHNGISIIGALFTEDFNLETSIINHRLRFEQCRFEKNINFTGIIALHGIFFKESTICEEFIMPYARISGPLVLDRSLFHGRVVLNDTIAQSFISANKTRFFDDLLIPNIEVGGFLSIRKALVRNVLMPTITVKKSIDMKNAKVLGSLNLNDSYVGGQLLLNELVIHGDCLLQRCRIDSRLVMEEATVRENLSFKAIRVDGDFILNKGLFEGLIDLSNADINGSLRLNDSSIKESILIYHSVLKFFIVDNERR